MGSVTSPEPCNPASNPLPGSGVSIFGAVLQESEPTPKLTLVSLRQTYISRSGSCVSNRRMLSPGKRMATGAGRFGRLTQSKERQHDHNNYDHADDVKYVVHRTLPSAAVSTVEDKKGSSAHAPRPFARPAGVCASREIS
jgi:hypothetical protein